MDLAALGRSGLSVSRVIFGAMALSAASRDERRRIETIHAALDAGISAIDTAPLYDFGRAEELLGRALAGRRDRVQILTKVGLRWDDPRGDVLFRFRDDRGREQLGVIDDAGAQTLRDLAPHLVDRVVWLDALPDEFVGVVVANELLDALPTHAVAWREEGLMERGVTLAGDRFAWAERPAPAALAAAMAELALAPSYENEISLAARAWVAEWGQRLKQGALLLIDYGLPRHELYHPHRNGGTLRCHYRQRAHENPFWWPGLSDITSHVDFTAVADAGFDAGGAFDVGDPGRGPRQARAERREGVDGGEVQGEVALLVRLEVDLERAGAGDHPCDRERVVSEAGDRALVRDAVKLATSWRTLPKESRGSISTNAIIQGSVPRLNQL